MPVRHRRSTLPAVRSQRRKLVWATFDNDVIIPNATPAIKVVDLLNQFELAGASKLGVTIMRTHLRMAFPFSNLTDRYELGISVARVTDIGTNFPNPNSDNDLDWALFDARWADASGATVNAQQVFEIDLRAKRKCQEMGQTWALSLWKNTAPVGATVHVFARTLVALP